MKISDSAERKLNCGKMPKPRRKAYLESALGEIVSLRIATNILHPKIRESRPARHSRNTRWPVGAEGNKATRAP